MLLPLPAGRRKGGTGGRNSPIDWSNPTMVGVPAHWFVVGGSVDPVRKANPSIQSASTKEGGPSHPSFQETSPSIEEGEGRIH